MRTFIISICVLLPCTACAQVELDEVMYDLPGSDDGREWIEIHNVGTGAVDMTDFRFSESGENHKLVLKQGSATVPADGYAVIANDSVKFLLDWPAFSGTLFDSSFSLSNTGETISIKAGTTSVLSEITYDPGLGGGGDGLSLQKNATVWYAGTPTPGTASNGVSAISQNEPTSSSSGTTAPVPTSSLSGSTAGPIPEAAKPHIFANAGPDSTAIVGVDTAFHGSALGVNKEPLTTGRFLWNFGDGSTAEGRSVYHRYRFPGSYIVSLNVSSSEWSSGDESMVTVISSPVTISRVIAGPNGLIELQNSYGTPVDISGWILKTSQTVFVLPEHTLLAARGKSIFPAETTGLTAYGTENVVVLYPNNVVATTFVSSAGAPKQMVSAVVPPQKKVGIAVTSEPVEAVVKEIPSDDIVILPPENGFVPKETHVSVPVPLSQAAAPLLAKPVKSNSLFPWLFAVGGLLVITLSGLVLSKKKPEHEGYTIIEGSGWSDGTQ